MEMNKTDYNLQIGRRLQDARENLNLSRAEIAEALDITEEHYRKLDNGITSLSLEKIIVLNEKFSVDPTYLILGEENNVKDFDLNYFVVNNTKEKRNEFVGRVMEYVLKMLK